MGLSSSKAHPKVTKVAPMRPTEDLPSLSALHQLPSVPGQPSLHPSDMEKWGKPIFHLELPPLRETWYGRASSGSCSCSFTQWLIIVRALQSTANIYLMESLYPPIPQHPHGPLSFNTALEKEGTSIIKQHPPRRPQRLEPAFPPQAISPMKPCSQRGAAASPKSKVLEKRGQSLNHLPGRRQHLHKLQMLDLTRRRREEELKRNLHREAKANKQKIKEFSPMDILDTLQRSNSNESRGPIPAEHNQHFHEDDRGNTWGGGLCRRHDGAELSPGRRGKVDLWFCREPRTKDLFWDTSSTGSEEWEREEKIHRKPALVRTKTERVSLFDDFFDRDF